MKVFLFGPYPPPYGGVATYISILYQLLKEDNYNCVLKVYGEDNCLDGHSLKYKFTSIYRSFNEITKDDICLDSCYFFLEYPSIRAILSWLLVKTIKRFKWVKVIHDGTLPVRYKNFNFIRKMVFHISSLFVNQFVVVNKDLGLWLTNTLKVNKKISNIGSLLPVPELMTEQAFSKEIEELVPKNGKLVCSIGVFTEDYGFKHIANAVQTVRKEHNLNIDLLLIDGGFECDTKYRNEVVATREWIKVLTKVPNNQVLQILKRSNVFVRGTAYEGYGLSRIEALWCGVPVVATKVGETIGMLLYDFGDEKMLIEQIKKALLEPPIEDIEKAKMYYQQKAEGNMKELIRLIEDAND